MHPKLVFVHPAIRPYRQELFELLGNRYDCQFIFVEDYEDNLSLMKTVCLKKWKAYKSCRFLFYSKGFTIKLIKDAFFGDYDVWVSSGLFHAATHLALPVILFRGKKFILFAEDWWFSGKWKNRVFKPVAKWIVKHCHAIVVSSDRSRDFFVALGAKPEKVFVGWNATIDYGRKLVDPRVLSDLKTELNPRGQFVFLYLNRIVPYKGLDVLIKAFAGIEKTNEALLLVAGDGEFKDRCRNMAQELDIKNIKFIGSVPPEMAHYYYLLANLFVLSARFMPKSNAVAEAWGFTVNEALSCGLPVVTTEAVAASEIISEGKNGFVVKSDDVEALRRAMKYFLCHKDRIQDFISQAKKTASQITPEHQATAMEKALNYIFYGNN
jgi:glycosyltransferase involved in cell wall biosynthesis